MPDASRPYRVLGYPWMPAFFVAAAVIGIMSAIISSPRTSALGALQLLAGVLAFVWFRRRRVESHRT
jgi:hypothetical protein